MIKVHFTDISIKNFPANEYETTEDGYIKLYKNASRLNPLVVIPKEQVQYIEIKYRRRDNESRTKK